MSSLVSVRPYQVSDAQALVDIFYHTIRQINIQDYTEAQVKAWAPDDSRKTEGWLKKWQSMPPLVAEIEGKVAGFCELNQNGYIDCFFVHHECQGQGVGKALMQAVDAIANEQKLYRVYADVSITAKPFFMAKGFKVIAEQVVCARNQMLKNYKMEKIYLEKSISIKELDKSAIADIVASFKASDWTEKPTELFEQYYEEMQLKERCVWLAYLNDEFAGYVTLVWQSKYPSFKNNIIPEIVDLNVLPKFRNAGVASALLDKAEQVAAESHKRVGIGVGLYSDYGNAQQLYIKRGYIPDGKGVTYGYRPTKPGESYDLDDDFILWFVKNMYDPQPILRILEKESVDTRN